MSRTRTRLPRRASRWALAAVLALCGVVVAQFAPGWEARHPRFEVHAAIGERVTTMDMSITVTRVTVAKTITQNPLERGAHTSPGVYVVVQLRGAARHQTVTLRHSLLRDTHGRLFVQSDSNLETFASVALETGVPLTGTLVFAVPRDAIGPELELVTAAQDPDPITLFDRSYTLGLDEPVVVPLRLDRDTPVQKSLEVPPVDFP